MVDLKVVFWIFVVMTIFMASPALVFIPMAVRKYLRSWRDEQNKLGLVVLALWVSVFPALFIAMIWLSYFGV